MKKLIELKQLVKLTCIGCEAEFLGGNPIFCCSGSDCGCLGMPIEPPLCEICERDFYNLSELAESANE